MISQKMTLTTGNNRIKNIPNISNIQSKIISIMSTSKKMKTRKDETIITTSDPSLMLNKYLVKPLNRSWSEPFIDEDTGEVFEIERFEPVLQRGTFIEVDQLAIINFHLQAGDVTEVTVSDQKRIGKFATSYGVHPWCVTVNLLKKHKFLCLARNIWQAIEIVEDYCEQKFDIVFDITSAKEFKQHTFIFDDTVKMVEEDGQIKTQVEVDEDRGIVYVFYSVEVSAVFDEGGSADYRYLVYAKDVNDAQSVIEKDIRRKIEAENEAYGLNGLPSAEMMSLTVKSAKQVNCSGVIGLEFTEAYCRDNSSSEEE